MDYTLKVYWGDALFNDLWGRGCHSFEIEFPTLRTSTFAPSSNDGLLEKSLDLIEEWRENAMV